MAKRTASVLSRRSLGGFHHVGAGQVIVKATACRPENEERVYQPKKACQHSENQACEIVIHLRHVLKEDDHDGNGEFTDQ